MLSCLGVHVSRPGRRGAEGQGKGRCAPCADAVAPRAQGPHREVGSAGSVERTCGTRHTNRIGGVVQPGCAGTQPRSPPSTCELCLINSASRHGRYDRVPREASQGLREVAGHGQWLREELSALIAGEESAEGKVGTRRVPKAGRGASNIGGGVGFLCGSRLAGWSPSVCARTCA
jgi:hypothetical protein